MFLRDLWDGGLRISQSVHTPQECNQIDAGNAELAVSLLDRRLLAGSEELFKPDSRSTPRSRPQHRATDERAARPLPEHDLSSGAERQRLRPADCAICRCSAGCRSSGRGIRTCRRGVPVLFEIRCFLHYLGGSRRQQTQLRAPGRNCGAERAPSPETLMREYYRAVRNIARLANRRLERFESKRSSLFSKFRDRTTKLSNSDFSVLHGVSVPSGFARP